MPLSRAKSIPFTFLTIDESATGFSVSRCGARAFKTKPNMRSRQIATDVDCVERNYRSSIFESRATLAAGEPCLAV